MLTCGMHDYYLRVRRMLPKAKGVYNLRQRQYCFTMKKLLEDIFIDTCSVLLNVAILITRLFWLPKRLWMLKRSERSRDS